LLDVFTTEGGLSTRTAQTYVYQDCPYFKVDVTFKPSGKRKNNPYLEDPVDITTGISHPYLQWSTMN